jgi:hypothetical protein
MKTYFQRASGQNYLSRGRKPPEFRSSQGAYAPRSGFCPLAQKEIRGTYAAHDWSPTLIDIDVRQRDDDPFLRGVMIGAIAFLTGVLLGLVFFRLS